MADITMLQALSRNRQASFTPAFAAIFSTAAPILTYLIISSCKSAQGLQPTSSSRQSSAATHLDHHSPSLSQRSWRHDRDGLRIYDALMKTREQQIIRLAKMFQEILEQNDKSATPVIDIAEAALKMAIPTFSIKITTSVVGQNG
jgi:hypothetical protein